MPLLIIMACVFEKIRWSIDFLTFSLIFMYRNVFLLKKTTKHLSCIEAILPITKTKDSLQEPRSVGLHGSYML